MTFSFIVVVVGAIAIGLFMRRNRNLLPAQLARQLPEFIDAVVLLMFSGSTPAQSLIAAPTWLEPPLREIVSDVSQQLLRGNRLSDCVASLRQLIGIVFPMNRAFNAGASSMPTSAGSLCDSRFHLFAASFPRL
jgi:Flp pilus assembly protein TadB